MSEGRQVFTELLTDVPPVRRQAPVREPRSPFVSREIDALPAQTGRDESDGGSTLPRRRPRKSQEPDREHQAEEQASPPACACLHSPLLFALYFARECGAAPTRSCRNFKESYHQVFTKLGSQQPRSGQSEPRPADKTAEERVHAATAAAATEKTRTAGRGASTSFVCRTPFPNFQTNSLTDCELVTLTRQHDGAGRLLDDSEVDVESRAHSEGS